MEFDFLIDGFVFPTILNNLIPITGLVPFNDHVPFFIICDFWLQKIIYDAIVKGAISHSHSSRFPQNGQLQSQKISA